MHIGFVADTAEGVHIYPYLRVGGQSGASVGDIYASMHLNLCVGVNSAVRVEDVRFVDLHVYVVDDIRLYI